MGYFLDTYISDKKKLKNSLIKVYGLGKSNVDFICKNLGFQNNVRFKDLNRNQLSILKKFIESNFLIGFDLKQNTKKNISSLISIKCYKGNRHKNGYRVRGQRSKGKKKVYGI